MYRNRQLYYRTHRESINAASAAYNKIHPEKHNEWQKRYAALSKRRVLDYYSDGTLQCECCKENTYEFLTIDHINGRDSRETEQKRRTGSQLYYWLVKEGFPEGLRVLCMNCNFALGMYAYCPHHNGGKVTN